VPEFFQKLFAKDFMPHGVCFSWDPAVLWLNVISDCLIAAAYYAIPILVLYFVAKRRDIAFKGVYVAVAVFVLACGTTHLMGAVTVWNPLYRVDGVIKAITAIASITTFAMLVPMMPMLISLPSPGEMARANLSLAREIHERRAAEEEVHRINEELEVRVAKRTAEHRALEDQLLQSQKMEAVGRLAGGVAHDFNNLLTVILGYNDMLRDRVRRDPAALEYADEVLHAAERASSLTNQLLAFSRRQVAVPRVVDLNDIVQGIDKMLRRIIGEDIQLETHLSPDIPPVKVDPSQVDQVIMNLAVNSRDAMPDGGTLAIETAAVELGKDFADSHVGVEAGPYVMLTVRDTGTGMDAATRTRVFEPFFTTKDKGKGTGLGLSIVYGIIKQNGGEIVVQSEPGKGTTFQIYLPAVLAAAEAMIHPSAEVAAQPATETILLVEDDPQVRNLTRTMLTHMGYHVLGAESAGEALRVAFRHEGALDLLLTDVVMPHMKGTDLADQIQVVRPGVRVLYMSGYTDIGAVEQVVLAEGTLFIQKPFTAAALSRLVREALRS
jgi:signal transduction histidine kinase